MNEGRSGESRLPVPALGHEIYGADDGIRTRDPNLGKVVLYQLSHVRTREAQAVGYQRATGRATAIGVECARFAKHVRSPRTGRVEGSGVVAPG
jgi:hypothetical protein